MVEMSQAGSGQEFERFEWTNGLGCQPGINRRGELGVSCTAPFSKIPRLDAFQRENVGF